MRNLLLCIAFGSTTLLIAAPMSTINAHEDVRQKRDKVHQHVQPQKQKKQISQRDTQRVEAKGTIRMQKQPHKTKQYHEQKRQVAKHINQRDSIQRTFRTHKEFNRARPHLRTKYYDTYHKRDYKRRHNIRQIGFVYFVNSWYLIYQNRHAPFYDQYGYFYGFFNQFGYYFEGIFYAYDRYYTYEDRLRGKGLFDNRYYEPYLEDGYADWYDIYNDAYYN